MRRGVTASASVALSYDSSVIAALRAGGGSSRPDRSASIAMKFALAGTSDAVSAFVGASEMQGQTARTATTSHDPCRLRPGRPVHELFTGSVHQPIPRRTNATQARPRFPWSEADFWYVMVRVDTPIDELITRRSQVQILPPLLRKAPNRGLFALPDSRMFTRLFTEPVDVPRLLALRSLERRIERRLCALDVVVPVGVRRDLDGGVPEPSRDLMQRHPLI